MNMDKPTVVEKLIPGNLYSCFNELWQKAIGKNKERRKIINQVSIILPGSVSSPLHCVFANFHCLIIKTILSS